jgi:hypothetical protein
MGHCRFPFPDIEFTDYECQLKVKAKYCRQYHHGVRLLDDPLRLYSPSILFQVRRFYPVLWFVWSVIFNSFQSFFRWYFIFRSFAKYGFCFLFFKYNFVSCMDLPSVFRRLHHAFNLNSSNSQNSLVKASVNHWSHIFFIVICCWTFNLNILLARPVTSET